VGYDVCGLAQNTLFTTDISVTRTRQPRLSSIRGGRIDPVALPTFADVAPSRRTRRIQPIDVSALPPGPYRLDVVITPRNKMPQQKSRQFEILEKKQP
jgi:hypothetical protein